MLNIPQCGSCIFSKSPSPICRCVRNSDSIHGSHPHLSSGACGLPSRACGIVRHKRHAVCRICENSQSMNSVSDGVCGFTVTVECCGVLESYCNVVEDPACTVARSMLD